MTNELVKVQFHGDMLDAVQDGDGKVWVSLRRCCENLGLSIQGQHSKLKNKPWACIKEILIHDASGREQPATMLHLDTLPMWLASIEPNKVKAAIREKLVKYQKECAKVLAAHFLPKQATKPADAQPESIAGLRDLLISEVMASISPIITELRALAAPVPQERWVTIPQQCRHWGWDGVSAKIQREIRDRAYELCWAEFGEMPMKTLNHTIWVGERQIAILNRAIVEIRNKYDRLAAQRGPSLPGME
jgi:hypothetical protein